VTNIAFAWRWLVESRKPGAPVKDKKPIWHSAWVVVRHPQRPVSRFIWIYGAGMLGFSAMTGVLALYSALEVRRGRAQHRLRVPLCRGAGPGDAHR
jgi:hypothetical protein